MDSSTTTVMITGASGNLGRALAATFGRRGARLVLLARDRAGLERTFGADSDKQLLLAADLLDAEAVAAAVAAATGRFGSIEVLCNIAGGFKPGKPVHETPDATWDFLLDLNARTLLHCVRAVVPQMLERGRGRIVNVGAYAARSAGARMGAYAAAKSAVIRLTEAMAAELRHKGINVNCVLPTTIDTPENRASMPDVDPSRWVAADDLANVIAFLASDDARAIHGAAIPVSGLS